MSSTGAAGESRAMRCSGQSSTRSSRGRRTGSAGAVRQVCLSAGVTKFGPYRLRQTFATGILASGATLQEVQGLLRHAHLSATAIYTKVDKNRLTQLCAFVDHGSAGTGEAFAILLRPGNAGSNTADEHIAVVQAPLAQLSGCRGVTGVACGADGVRRLRWKFSNSPSRARNDHRRPGTAGHTGRRLVMHLPTRWPWHQASRNLWDTATSPPSLVTTQPRGRDRRPAVEEPAPPGRPVAPEITRTLRSPKR